MFNFLRRSREKTLSLPHNPHRVDIIAADDRSVETLFRPGYDDSTPQSSKWEVVVPRNATIISHSASEGIFVRGKLNYKHLYTDAGGQRHLRELNPEVAEVAAHGLDPLMCAQKGFRQLFPHGDQKVPDKLDPLQLKMVDKIQGLSFDTFGRGLSERDRRHRALRHAAQESHHYLEHFAGPTFVDQAIARAGGLNKITPDTITEIQKTINKRQIKPAIEVGVRSVNH